MIELLKSILLHATFTAMLVGIGFAVIDWVFPQNNPKQEEQALDFFLNNRKDTANSEQKQMQSMQAQLDEIKQTLSSRVLAPPPGPAKTKTQRPPSRSK